MKKIKDNRLDANKATMQMFDQFNTTERKEPGKQITFNWKGEEITALAHKIRDKYYKIIDGPLAGKEVHTMNLIFRMLIISFTLLFGSCADTSNDDMNVDRITIDSVPSKDIMTHLEENDMILDSCMYYAQKRVDYELKRDEYALMFGHTRNAIFHNVSQQYVDSALYINRCLQFLNQRVQGRVKK